MRATIRDVGVLSAIRPLEVASYLRSRGWAESSSVALTSSTWEKAASAGAGYEILLPLNRHLRDYPYRINDVLTTLEAVEDRSQLEILSDLMSTSSDVIRVRSLGPEAADGSIPIDEGVGLVEHARDMMVAAACAALEPRAAYPGRKAKEVTEYVSKTRMGQTERGSYVVSIISPVAPCLAAAEEGKLFEDTCADDEEPFERLVTVTLSRGLHAMGLAAERAASTGTLEPFLEAVKSGLSANLCAAIAGLAHGDGELGALDIDVSWSRARPQASSTPSHFSVESDAVPVIEEAGRLLRSREPQEHFRLYGPVFRLQQRPDESRGTITVVGMVDDRPRNVVVELEGPEYHLAISAHENHEPIVVTGDLVKDGRSYVLKNPKNLDLVPFDEERE